MLKGRPQVEWGKNTRWERFLYEGWCAAQTTVEINWLQMAMLQTYQYLDVSIHAPVCVTFHRSSSPVDSARRKAVSGEERRRVIDSNIIGDIVA